MLHNVGWRCGSKMDHQWELHPQANTGWDRLGWRCSICGAISDEERGMRDSARLTEKNMLLEPRGQLTCIGCSRSIVIGVTWLAAAAKATDGVLTRRCLGLGAHRYRHSGKRL